MRNEHLLYYSFRYALYHRDLISGYVVESIKKEWDSLSWKQQIKHDLAVALGYTNMSEHYVINHNKKLWEDLWYFIIVQDALEPLIKKIREI